MRLPAKPLEERNKFVVVDYLKEKDKIKAIREGRYPAPAHIQIDLEAFCNHDCSFCSYRNAGFQTAQGGMNFQRPEWSPNAIFKATGDPKGKIVKDISGLPRDVALRVLDDMIEVGCKSIEVTGGGESLASPYINDFLAKTKDLGIRLSLVTNGTMLGKVKNELFDNPFFHWLRVSLDSATAETHQRIHGTNSQYGRILKNIREYVELRGRNGNPKIAVSFVVVPENVEEIGLAAARYKGMGVNAIRFTSYYSNEMDGALKPQQRREVEDRIRSARDIFEDENFGVFGGTWKIDNYGANDDFSYCGYMHFTWAIGYDGGVYPCCIQKYYQGSEMGNVKDKTLKQILEQDTPSFVERFDVKRCQPCWLRDHNKAIEYVASTFADSPRNTFAVGNMTHLNFDKEEE